MAENTQSQSVMQVSLPEEGGVTEYRMSSDVSVKFSFFVSEVLFSCDGTDLVLTGENGGSVVLKDYLTMAQEDALPVFELHGGEEVPGNIYLFAFNESAMAVETAAGTPGDGSEMEEFLDEQVSPGNLFHGPASVIEDSSSALEPVHTDSHGHIASETLCCAEIFSDHHMSGGAAFVGTEASSCGSSLLGVAPVLPDVDMVTCSLVDIYDPINDTIQQLVESPHYL
ncbi:MULTISPECIES: hypothetical protein [unclassified Pseudodesulfovibrio]|uniref:hypothetical protein n=1 Tax=unclassified Pseudodesulfovibrio TaxID=2661612 RepID=UPI000FEBB86A|nr:MULTISPECIES: hypothetical protein [unclassified Pseudodesulfovibrio]MCJ2164235.1 hypothetical protein [Pseudodesulfovibrio sp. S3-i]RWU05141.1 hypothetical protein DWB63_05660 [Pseudodesulfovibrio sp. S3]